MEQQFCPICNNQSVEDEVHCPLYEDIRFDLHQHAQLCFSNFMLLSDLEKLCVIREKEMFYLTMHSTHFIYGYMASYIWLRTILIVRKETRCRHISINSKGSFICTIPQTG